MRLAILALALVVSLANAAWIHDLVADHDHEDGDATMVVCVANDAPAHHVLMPVPVAVIISVVTLPQPVALRLPLVEYSLPPARAPSFTPAPPRAPPFA